MLILSLAWILNVLLILLSVAFFTLFERKVIGLVHLRLGPNKVSFLGLLQPLLDAFKLLTKQQLVSLRRNKTVYYATPLFSLVVSIMFWTLLPTFFFVNSNSFRILIYLLLGSLIVLLTLFAGWSSNSKYTFIGSLRSIAQSVSYEAVFSTLVILLCVISHSYSIISIRATAPLCLLFLVGPLWLFSLLAETHRAPFDFRESESELVRGYNTEYGGGHFAFLFLAEYSALLFGSAIIVTIFLSYRMRIIIQPPIFSFLIILVTLFITIIRVSFCRLRYDNLISLAWKSLLPVSLSIFILIYSFYFFIFLISLKNIILSR